jgi:hypothetical protein
VVFTEGPDERVLPEATYVDESKLTRLFSFVVRNRVSETGVYAVLKSTPTPRRRVR